MGKTYAIRKVGGGRGVKQDSEKKNECWSLFHILPPPWTREEIGMEGLVVQGDMSGKIPALLQQFWIVVVSTSFHASSAICIACN